MKQLPIRRSAALTLAAATLMMGAFTALAGGGGAPPTAASPGTGTPALRVTTTMAGLRMKNLPLRMQWDARANVPDTEIEKVQFFIDGKPASTPTTVPYVYAGRDKKGAPSRFVTTWLKPGPHTFTTIITTKDGRTASETVVANVIAPPALPAALTGGWERVVTSEDNQAAFRAVNDITDPPLPEFVLNQPWRLVFEDIGLWIIEPEVNPAANLEHIMIQGNTMKTLGGIQMVPASVEKTVYGYPFGAHQCDLRTEGSYTWAVIGDELTIKTTKAACVYQRATLDGTWTRVKNLPPRNLTIKY